ncbi:hypothetical protein SUGI_0858110 [Cryptomeria japonica]|nr:hypothetical protein SUGI_0858110 [Cryptomeria japonica]
MESAQQRNRLQKRAPPPLKVKPPQPSDLFVKSTAIPLLSPLSFPDKDGDGDQPKFAAPQQKENGKERAAAAARHSRIFTWESDSQKIAASSGARILL